MPTTVRKIPKGRAALLAVFLAILIAGLHWRLPITDWFRLHDYTPPKDVAALAQRDGFTDTGSHLFYINHPELVVKDKFKQKCTTEAEQTIVLGCYHGGESGIYVLRIVDDPRLDGVMSVTAAHEMLHAAYERLSAEDKAQVDGWLQDYYYHGLQDVRIRKTIEAYKKSEPDGLTSEMHSVFGTEVSNLPSPLENYYKQYFKNRQTVTALAQSYSAEFTGREAQVAAYDAQLSALKTEITANEASLGQQEAAIKAEAADMERLKSNGQAAAYNAKVDDYNSKVNAYNALVNATKQKISQYNDLVTRRNAIALQQQQLVKELGGDGFKAIQ